MRLLLVFAVLLFASSSPSAQEGCPPCECNCVSPESDPSRLETGSVEYEVGVNDERAPLLQGPLVLTSLSMSVDCPAALVLRTPSGAEVMLARPAGRLFIPAGATLELHSTFGFCRGVASWSGFRPD